MPSKQKILIVDDDANIAELISLYLTKEFYEVQIVEDGEQALQIFNTFQPNLILLDLMLPGMDGYQVCREIRTRSNIPIIMLSAKGEALKDQDEDQRKLISNISHDFRSPLTSIKGYIEAMLDGTIPFEMQEKYLNIVLRETERLSKLTSGLLALNSIDPRQNRLSRSRFDINTVIKNTAATFEGTCTSKRISIELLFTDWESYVYADMGKIQQVLYNLIDNAIKFSQPDSVITIETTIKYEKIFVSVRDTGIGIPKDSLNKIWERFYKSDASRGKDKSGTGLGLSIVKEILQLHNENINVISTEGVGTEFIFSLSRASEEEKE